MTLFQCFPADVALRKALNDALRNPQFSLFLIGPRSVFLWGNIFLLRQSQTGIPLALLGICKKAIIWVQISNDLKIVNFFFWGGVFGLGVFPKSNLAIMNSTSAVNSLGAIFLLLLRNYR